MNSDLKFYRCQNCTNVIIKLHDSGVTPNCCGMPVKLIPVNATDGDPEAHTPYVSQDGCEVQVRCGLRDHPMTEDHFIEWICILTDKGYQVKHLKQGCAPQVYFYLGKDEKFIKAYAYCNKHSLWCS